MTKQKTIGMIGGMSWESSAVYYTLVNQKIKEKLGGYHSCQCLMYSVDFAEVEDLQHKDDWEALNNMMIDAAKRLEKGGADLLILCTNTMHLSSPSIIAHINIPFLHIAEAASEAIAQQRLKKVGLLGTKFTMEKDFYKNTLLEKHGIEVIVPGEKKRDAVHRVIYQELVQGIINNESRKIYKKIIEQLQEQGAEGIILGCTEIPMLIQKQDVELPVFDTTTIHAEKAVDWAFNN